MLQLVVKLQEKIAPDSVLVLQSEKTAMLDELPDRIDWDERRYGRKMNSLSPRVTPAYTAIVATAAPGYSATHRGIEY